MFQNFLSLLNLDHQCNMSSEREEMPGFQCTWKIENFQYFPDGGRGLRSSTFVPDTLDLSKWRLCVLPRTGIDGKYISLFLYRHSGGVYSITIDYEFEIISADGSTFAKLRHPKKVFRNGTIHGFTNLVSRSDAFQEGLLAFGPHTFTVVCRMWNGEEKPSIFGHCTIRTVIGTFKRSFDWVLDHFSDFSPNQEKFCPVELKANLPLKLKIFFSDVICEDELQIDVIGDKSAKPYLATCKVSVLGTGLKTLLSVEDDHMFSENNDETPWKFPRFITKTKVTENREIYLPKDALTLRFVFVASNGTVAHEISNDSPSVDSNRSTEINSSSFLREDLNRLYRDQIFCDINLRTESGEIFQAHKNIICARSPVLRMMIENSMKDMLDNIVEIPNIDGDTLKRMLTFIYADTVDELMHESASKLYAAANQFLLPGLQVECSTFLKCNLSVENVCGVLVLAYSHSDPDLKSAAKDFILENEKTVIRSENWNDVFRNNLQLAAETLQWLCFKKHEDEDK